jgi:predicted metal-binding protein
MNPTLKIIEELFPEFKEIPASDIELKASVRKMCEQNRCGNYGKSWTCPPAVQSLEDFKSQMRGFSKFVVVYKVYNLKSEFDWNGMIAACKLFQEDLVQLKRSLAVKGGPERFLVLGAGGCQLCNSCAYPQGEPCRNPDEAIVSVEACGIDVMSLMKSHDLKYYNGPNTVTYIGGVAC